MPYETVYRGFVSSFTKFLPSTRKLFIDFSNHKWIHRFDFEAPSSMMYLTLMHMSSRQMDACFADSLNLTKLIYAYYMSI